MKKNILSLLLMAMPLIGAMAQDIEMTSTQAKSLYTNTSKQRVSVHDPSVVWEPSTKRYYIFGSHRACAYTTDMKNWTAFHSPWKAGASNDAANESAFLTPAVKKVKKGGVEVDFPQFNAMEWAARTDASYNIGGNMWAPDVIWNPVMNKWCQYLSINGDKWHSSIILLTSDKIEGPYLYQGPIVISGFQDSGHSYKDTDLELVLGEQSSLPARYNVGSSWGRRYPNNIDPCVFYDEEGKLWMAYGSWSGGIWMLELDEETGLRDYDVEYKLVGSGDGITTDPYFGKKVAGGYYVSGEAPYIEYIGGYYYLFVTYGGLEAAGGYVMRVFRSKNPNGPYLDASNHNAIFDSYKMNYGKSADNRGVKILGAYDHWGFQSQGTAKEGELSQGHNSIIAAPDGRTYLVYHTRFNTGNEGHQVRVHQVFQTKNGWLVAAPFEYNGDQLTDEDIKTRQLFSKKEIAGTYNLLVHKYAIDYANLEMVEPTQITLHEDGTVSGSGTGTWSIEDGTSYLTLKLGTVVYNGVLMEQTMDKKNIKTVSFSALANSGVNIWGYKYRDDYALAWQLNNQKIPVSSNQFVKKNIDLYGMSLLMEGIGLQWTSSRPDVISNYGKYYPIGLAEDTEVTLEARLTKGNYFWQQAYKVRAASEENAKAVSESWKDGMVAHYTFDDAELANSLNASEKAQLLRNGSAQLPVVDTEEPLRNGATVHLSFGANGKESYVSMPNPLKGKSLTDGATLAFFVKRTDNNLWDALFGMVSGTSRLYMTGNLYLGFNDGTNYLDINHPTTIETGKLGTGQWNHVVVTFSRTVSSASGGITIYVNGTKTTDKYKEMLNGTEATTKQGFDYNLILDHMASCDNLCLGNGSFWGSADVRFDDVQIYDRALSLIEIMALTQMMDRSDKAYDASGIQHVDYSQTATDAVYDLQGRRLDSSSGFKPGLYIKDGKKYMVRP